mgnify:FL=1
MARCYANSGEFYCKSKASAKPQELIPVILSSCRMAQDTTNTLLLASDLRERYKFAYWDSLIVAAALDAGCDTLYTEDMQHKQVIDGRLRLINPFVAA